MGKDNKNSLLGLIPDLKVGVLRPLLIANFWNEKFRHEWRGFKPRQISREISHNYYDSISQGYEELHREEQLHKMAIIKAEVDIRPDDLLLDVGCGTGLTCDFPCRVIGMDPAIQLLKRAPPGLPVIQGEAEHIPFANDTFDIVSSITAIQNFHDIKAGLREIRRVGKDWFILTFLSKSKKKDEIEGLIDELFVVDKRIEERHDTIFLCRKGE